MNDKTAEVTPRSESSVRKSEDFRDYYANNTFFQSTLWDLRILFGQVDQTLEGNPTIFRSSVSIPWPQVKVMYYFLQLHLAGYEAKNGKIEIPAGVIPEFPSTPMSGAPDEEWTALRKTWEKFIAENPESK